MGWGESKWVVEKWSVVCGCRGGGFWGVEGLVFGTPRGCFGDVGVGCLWREWMVPRGGCGASIFQSVSK